MSEKSKVKINPTKFQKNLNAVCWILFLAFLGYSFFAWQHLPEMIPKHFNGAGVIDAYWSKNHFFFLPIMSAVTYLTISICEFFPQSWNIPQKKGASPLQNERNLSLCLLHGNLAQARMSHRLLAFDPLYRHLPQSPYILFSINHAHYIRHHGLLYLSNVSQNRR